MGYYLFHMRLHWSFICTRSLLSCLIFLWVTLVDKVNNGAWAWTWHVLQTWGRLWYEFWPQDDLEGLKLEISLDTNFDHEMICKVWCRVFQWCPPIPKLCFDHKFLVEYWIHWYQVCINSSIYCWICCLQILKILDALHNSTVGALISICLHCCWGENLWRSWVEMASKHEAGLYPGLTFRFL
jgi:hypothetical protein